MKVTNNKLSPLSVYICHTFKLSFELSLKTKLHSISNKELVDIKIQLLLLPFLFLLGFFEISDLGYTSLYKNSFLHSIKPLGANIEEGLHVNIPQECPTRELRVNCSERIRAFAL